MSYQPTVPTGSVPLNQDYLNVQGNFSSLDTQWKVDHVPLTTAPGPSIGYHTFVHLVPFSTTATNPPNNQPVTAPAATPGFGQLFSAQINDGINTDQALYYLSGGGRLSQLTRNIQPVNAAKGVSFLPGGLLIQWGFSNNGGTFQQTFSNLFSVTFSPNTASNFLSSPPTITASSTSGFTVGNAAGQTFPVWWMAIGN